MKIRGFTIIELVLVIAILGVMGIAAIVRTPDPRPAAVLAAARQIHSDISYAQQNAMMTGIISGVSFIQNGAYTVYQGTTATPLTSPLTNRSMVITPSVNYENVVVTSNFVVEYNNFGAPVTGGGGTVQVSNGTTTKTIAIAANTGMVSIQ